VERKCAYNYENNENNENNANISNVYEYAYSLLKASYFFVEDFFAEAFLVVFFVLPFPPLEPTIPK
jgi:hypothetical protein